MIMIINGIKVKSLASNILSEEFKKEGLFFETHPISDIDKAQYTAIMNSILRIIKEVENKNNDNN